MDLGSLKQELEEKGQLNIMAVKNLTLWDSLHISGAEILKHFKGYEQFKNGLNTVQVMDQILDVANDYFRITTFDYTISDYHYPEIQILRDHQKFLLGCSCETKEGHCVHKLALLLHLNTTHFGYEGIQGLENIESKIAKELKSRWGLSYTDPWGDYFTLELGYTGISLIPIDPDMIPGNSVFNWKNALANYMVSPRTLLDTLVTDGEMKKKPKKDAFSVCWLNNYHGFQLSVLKGKLKKNGGFGAPIAITEVISEEYSDEFVQIQAMCDKIRTKKLKHRYNDNQDDTKVDRYFFHQEINRNIDLIAKEINFYTEEHEPRRINTLIPVRVLVDKPTLKFELKKDEMERFYTFEPVFVFEEFELKGAQLSTGIITVESNKGELTVFLSEGKDLPILEFFYQMDGNSVKIMTTELQGFLKDFVYPLCSSYEVKADFDLKITKQSADTYMESRVYLEESVAELIIYPTFQYFLKEDDHFELPEQDMNGALYFQTEMPNGKDAWLDREVEKEKRAQKLLESMHPNFPDQGVSGIYRVSLDQVLENGWFFKFVAELEENQVEIFGLKGLKNIKVAPYTPSIRLTGGTGIDWLQLDVDIAFGKEKVSLSKMRKALFKGENFVRLSDGQLGMLPDEWLAKYGTILRAGKEKKETLEIPTLQHVLFDDIKSDLDNIEFLEELEKKKQKLKDFRGLKDISVPENVNATLRPYQLEGVKWLGFLHDIGWGGCLADDMGLGKTLQMLTHIQIQANKKKSFKAMVVVPRSLVFNWISEAEKFCPELSVLDFSTSDRESLKSAIKKHQLIVTTYGIALREKDFFSSSSFDVIVLDESQAIKNPMSQTFQALKELKAKHKLVITGTPVENGTTDLFAQMDFVNPGMLGSLKNFVTEFAVPIDRDKSELISSRLKQIVYPFILQRTKKQVATDLPAKTETVLYCEMTPKQRKVYDLFKDKIKEDIENTIETEGWGQAGMQVIQGLQKLRQICDSTYLLNDANYGHHSAKLDLLMEYVEEIVAKGHKVLVFSFFKGMLSEIEKAMHRKAIGTVKLTGESRNREQLVHEFKTNPKSKVFLISLKAGGVGLNLTEANYVFLVDPWWNPAVEQQAIDRTHRIGQKSQVFSYKIICKDSIEEKILALQEMKKNLSDELINTEGGFLKQINPDDLRNLFS